MELRYVNEKFEMTLRSRNGIDGVAPFEEFCDILNKLDNLLSLKVFFRNPKKSVLLKRVSNAIKYINTKNVFLANREIAALKMLADDLERAGSDNEDNLVKLRKKLREQKDCENSWTGFRFEAHLAGHLSRLGIKNVIVRDAPDIHVDYNGHEFFIEATSKKINAPKRESVFYKIDQPINVKNNKNWANENMLLCVDVTSVFFNDHNPESVENYDEYIRSLTERTDIKYGAIMFFLFYSDGKGFGSKHHYIAYEHCSVGLLSFLQDNFPEDNGGVFQMQIAEYS